MPIDPLGPLISNILKWEEKRQRELLKQKENQAKDIAKLKEDLMNLTGYFFFCFVCLSTLIIIFRNEL